MKKNLILASLLLLIGLGIGTYIAQEQERKEWLKEQNDDLQRQLEQSTKQLEDARRHRDLANRTSDSLYTVSKNLSTKLEEKDKEIIKIKGRYKDVPQDSLGIIMDRRANRHK